MKALILSLALLVGFINSAEAQKNECLNDFNFLVQKIKADYPGYDVKVTPKSKPELLKLETDLRKKIELYPDSSSMYLKEYAAWFKDNHLRVSRNRTGSDKQEAKTSEKKFVALNVDSLIARINGLETIEGLWHSYRGDIAILKDTKLDQYYGIALQFKGFDKNQLMFVLQPGSCNEFSMLYYQVYNHFKASKGAASIRLNNKVLELHDDCRFVKKSSSEVYDNALLSSYIAEFPNGRNTYPIALALSDSTFYLRVSSFASDCAEKEVNKHWTEIISRPNLIIDIRNNGGGQDNYYATLANLLYTHPYNTKGVEWYATKNNISFFEEAMKKGEIKDGEEGLKWTRALVDAMKKSVGGFVIHPMMGKDNSITKEKVYAYPKKVGIIINEGNASSAEQFLLTAKNSSKVTLFGNCNTAGVLDYSNAVSVNFPSNKFELTYPMTRSRRLPENPIDNIGIAPDVMIPFPATEQLFDRLDQWAYFVQNYLELMK